MKHLAILTLVALATTSSAALVDQFPQSTKRKGIAPIPSPAKPVCTSNLFGKCYAYKPQTCPEGYYISKQKYGTPKAHRCFAGVRIVKPLGSGPVHCTPPLGDYSEYGPGRGSCTFALGGVMDKGLPANIPLYNAEGLQTGEVSKNKYCVMHMICPDIRPRYSLHSVCIWPATSAKMHVWLDTVQRATPDYTGRVLVQPTGWLRTTFNNGKWMDTASFSNTQDYPPYLLNPTCYWYTTVPGGKMTPLQKTGSHQAVSGVLKSLENVFSILTLI